MEAFSTNLQYFGLMLSNTQYAHPSEASAEARNIGSLRVLQDSCKVLLLGSYTASSPDPTLLQDLLGNLQVLEGSHGTGMLVGYGV